MRRSTVVMLVILVILAGLYWYLQQPENLIERATQPTPTAAQADLGRLIPAEKGSITRISVEHSSGASATLNHSTGDWILTTAKGELPMDSATTDVMVSGLFNLKIMSRIDPAPDLASIALDPPRYRFSLLMADGSQVNFSVGKQTVIQSGYYLQTADGNVYVVATSGIDALVNLAFTQNYPQTPTP